MRVKPHWRRFGLHNFFFFFQTETHTPVTSEVVSNPPWYSARQRCLLQQPLHRHRSTQSNRYRFMQSPVTKAAAIPVQDVRWRWRHCHRHHSTCKSCTCSTICMVPPARGKGRPQGEAHRNQQRYPQPVQNENIGFHCSTCGDSKLNA